MKEAEAKFVEELAPIGSSTWRGHFRKRYGEVAFTEVREFLDKGNKERNAAFDEALRTALSSAARLS